MTGPGETASRIALAWLLGCGAGLVYSFFRPLRPAHTCLSDLLFLPALSMAWLWLSFEICQGDLRLGYSTALLAGAIAFDRTVGTGMQPIFRGFWAGLDRVFHGICLPGKIFFKKTRKFAKKILAIGEKWVTIKWNTRRHLPQKTGGFLHDKPSKNSAGASAQPHCDQVCGSGGTRIVYGGASGTGSGQNGCAGQTE